MQGFLRTLEEQEKMRTIILIDGSNFYFKLKDIKLNNLLEFNFRSFARSLLENRDVLKNTTYYVGRIRQDGSKKTEKLFANQQRLMAKLRENRVRYSFGFLMKAGNRYHEKGVDVQIATDILVAAYENSCDKIIIVSSDTDLAPDIKIAKKKGKQVRYIGFSHLPSKAMIKFCSSHQLLDKNNLEKFIKKTP